MAIQCRNCPLRRKEVFSTLSGPEIAFMEKLKVGELRVDRGTPLLLEGSSSPQLYTALSGMGLRYKSLEGGQRQVINFIFPGDFLGLQTAVMGEMQHSVEATTDMTLCVFDRREFWSIFRSHPERAFDVTWLAAVEEHFLGEALSSIGQLPAQARMAWALLRLYHRADALGMTRDQSFPMPYRQQDLADALGLSLVHTNKTLARLRDRQLANWRDGRITLYDLPGLERLSGFDTRSGNMRRPLI